MTFINLGDIFGYFLLSKVAHKIPRKKFFYTFYVLLTILTVSAFLIGEIFEKIEFF